MVTEKKNESESSNNRKFGFQFPKVCQSSSFLSLPCVQIEILTQTRQEMNLVPSDSLSRLVMDWIKRAFSTTNENSFTYDTFVNKVKKISCRIR